jgi:hypothetical protein
MPTPVAEPTRIQAAGNKPKLIDEYIGERDGRFGLSQPRCFRTVDSQFLDTTN